MFSVKKNLPLNSASNGEIKKGIMTKKVPTCRMKEIFSK